MAALEPHRVVAVVGNQREQVGPHIQELLPDAVLAVQETQDGTGHAVRVAWEALDPADRSGTVLVAYGDTPLLEGEVLRAFAEDHAAAGRGVSILSGVVANPFGYGRVLRDDSGEVTGIVEQKDATAEQAAVTEINSGILAFDAAFLDSALPRLTNDNAKGEYYLTDTVAARPRGRPESVGAFPIDDVLQTEGANDRAQLAALAKEKNHRILTRWMQDGVTIIDPDTTWIDVDVRLEPDVTILPGRAAARRHRRRGGRGDRTGLHAQGRRGRRGRARRTHPRRARGHRGRAPTSARSPTCVPAPSSVPAARSAGSSRPRTPGSATGRRCRTCPTSGTPRSARAPTSAPARSSPTTTASQKHRTVIGRHARTASNNTFVAPVHIGDGAGTGAGSVIREDVPPGALAVSAGPQRNIEGWAAAQARRVPPRPRRPRQPATPTEDPATTPDSVRRVTRSSRRRPWWVTIDLHRRHSHDRGAPQRERMKNTTEKNLMVFSGRAHPELAEEVAEQLGTGWSRPRPTSSPTPRSTSATRSRCAAATPS